MNGPASLADDARSTARRRRTRINAIAVLGALALVAMFVLRAHPLLSADEKQMVGRWYTVVEVGEEEVERIVWIDEWRVDRSLEVKAQMFRRASSDPTATWRVQAAGVKDHLAGTWSIERDKCIIVERSDRTLSTLWQQVQAAVKELQWPATRADEVAFEVRFTPDGVRELDGGLIFGKRLLLRSVRVPDDFEMPDEPFEPEDVLAWWEQQRSQKGKTANGRE